MAVPQIGMFNTYVTNTTQFLFHFEFQFQFFFAHEDNNHF